MASSRRKWYDYFDARSTQPTVVNGGTRYNELSVASVILYDDCDANVLAKNVERRTKPVPHVLGYVFRCNPVSNLLGGLKQPPASFGVSSFWSMEMSPRRRAFGTTLCEYLAFNLMKASARGDTGT